MSRLARVSRRFLAQSLGMLLLPVVRRRTRREARPWIIGEAAGLSYSDNSATFHRFLRKQHPSIPVFWVAVPGSRAEEQALRLGPVLPMYAPMTVARSLLSQVQIISHGVHDVPALTSALSRHSLKVRLGHGITALKQTQAPPLKRRAYAGALFDLAPVASGFEQKAKQEWGFATDQLPITGLPRFDRLLELAREIPRDRSILYFPTWRDRLGSRIADDRFVEAVDSLLDDKRLRGILETRGLTLRLATHPKHPRWLVRRWEERVSERVQVLESFGIPEALAKADLLITDHSSLTWDFLYLDRPVAFFRPDSELFYRDRGDYLFETEALPGPTFGSPGELREAIENHFSGSNVIGVDREWQKRVFAHRDDRNCERVLRAIRAALESRKRGGAR